MTPDFSKCKMAPYAHQKRGIEELLAKPRFGLFWAMRLGKSKAVIDTASFLFEAKEIQVVLVAAPAQVCEVWANKELGEIKKHCFVPYKTWVFNSSNSDYLHLLVQAIDKELVFIVVSHELLRQEDSHGDFPRVNQLLEVIGDKAWWLVIDECCNFSNYKSLQTKAIMKLRSGQRT